MLADGRVAVLYARRSAERNHRCRRSSATLAGTWGEPGTLVPQGIYPRIATRGERTAVAFTCRSGEDLRVVVADWEDLMRGEHFAECAAKKSASL